MTNSTSEREQRLKQVRENRRNFYGGMGELTSDIDFLLSLLDGQAVSDNRTVLDQVLIEARADDPVGAHLTELSLQQDTEPDIYDAVRDLIRDDAATRMRDLCVEKVKAYRLRCEQTGVELADKEDESSQRMYWRADGAADALEIIEGELQSLTLNSQQPVKEESCCISALIFDR